MAPFFTDRQRCSVVPILPPAPADAKRSVLFLHNSYYHFKYLAAALRKRGWDALLVTMHDPQRGWKDFFHGEDVNLYSSDEKIFSEMQNNLFESVQNRFKLVHFAGMFSMSFFEGNYGNHLRLQIPWDFLALKRSGVKLGYTISGCNDGIRQSTFKEHTGVCSKCVWENHPEVCSNTGNHMWGEKLLQMCDLVACETDYALEYRTSRIAFKEPLTMCLDPDIWDNQLPIPEELKIERGEGELIVLHGFGKAADRMRYGRDIKGSRAIHRAVAQLISEGAKIKLVNPVDIPSINMRFLQAQADIVVDQLNYGRYGAQARESMMMGKPTICHIDDRQASGVRPLRSLKDCPLIEADEESIYFVLKALVHSPQERARIGQISRAYAMKWHSADACAIWFEKVYDRIMQGLPPEADEVFAGDWEDDFSSRSRLHP